MILGEAQSGHSNMILDLENLRGGPVEKNTLYFIKALFKKVTEDLSLDATPTLQPTVMAMLKEDVEEVIKNEEQEEVVVGQVTDEEEAEPLTHLVSEMPESDIPAYIGRLKW